MLARKRSGRKTASGTSSGQGVAIEAPDIVVVWARALKAVGVVGKETLVGADVAGSSGDNCLT